MNIVIKVIAHGVPSIFFSNEKNDVRIKHGLPTDKKIVLSVASDINRKLKGFKEIIATAKKMPDIIFILVGTKSNKLKRYLILFIQVKLIMINT